MHTYTLWYKGSHKRETHIHTQTNRKTEQRENKAERDKLAQPPIKPQNIKAKQKRNKLQQIGTVK